MISGLRWKVSEQGAMQGSRIIVTLLLARRLLPRQFGFAGMVLVCRARLRKAADWRVRRARTAARQYAGLIGWRRQFGPPTAPWRINLGRVDSIPQPVVMCTWHRLERLERTCELLAAQTVPVDLYIWNNNPHERARVDTAARGAPIQVNAVHSRGNVGGFGRFYLARELAAASTQVVFIDDDQEFSPGTIERLLASHRSLTLSGWWAWRFPNPRNYAQRERAAPGEQAHYVGTGGMIVDTSVFGDARVFSCPRRFWFAEDLWLCYVAEHHLGWDLFRSGADFTNLNDEHDLFTALGTAKNRLLRDLVRRGWNLAA